MNIVIKVMTIVLADLRLGVHRPAGRQGIIQGQSCRGLDGEGLEQARRLAGWYGPVDRVITSPLARARQTAEVLAGPAPVEESPEVIEIGCGAWEGLSYPEVLENDPDTAARIFDRGEDLPRGGTGETFAQVAERMDRFLTNLIVEPERRTLVVSHGGAIRSLVGSITGAGGAARRVLATPDNSGVTHVALTPDGPVLADYSIAPHLEEPALSVGRPA
jgi:broad specificity phosphatase PhoE